VDVNERRRTKQEEKIMEEEERKIEIELNALFQGPH
jgi:hypothetical protein